MACLLIRRTSAKRRTEFKVVSMEGKEFEQIVRTNEAYKEEDEDEEDKDKN